MYNKIAIKCNLQKESFLEWMYLMDKKPTFNQIENHREFLAENEFFIQYFNEKLPDRYDANCMLLKYSPTLPEFTIIEQIQIDTQEDLEQNHLKFLWPEDTGIMPEVLDYLDQKDYKIGMQSLYCVTKDILEDIKINNDLKIVEVTEAQFDDFVAINLEEDALHGPSFKVHKEKMYPYQFQLDNTTFILGYLKNKPVGSMIIFEGNDHFEIDNVLTISDFRKNKIASTLIKHVINKYGSQKESILLVADSEDSVINLYENLGFQFISKQITAEKENIFT